MTDAAQKPSRRRTVLGVAIILALLAAALATSLAQRRRGAKEEGVTVSDTRSILSTYVTLTVVAPSEEIGRARIREAFELIQHLEGVLSAHAQDSELAKVNARAGQEPVQVSEELFNAVQAGVEWHAKTNGAFDITIKPLLDLWRTAARSNRLPTDDELARARSLLGADRIQLDPSQRTVKFPVEGMRIDLGGLGKGYIADRVVELLKSRGVKGALVANAGDIYALGKRADGLPWRVGIQDPRQPKSPEAILTVVELSDQAVSTSGNYQRFVEIQGKHYSHIVDPRTAFTADNVPSVSVIGPNTLATDILGTALSVLGVKEGKDLVEKMSGVEAMFILFDENNEPLFTRSRGFRRYEQSLAVEEKP